MEIRLLGEGDAAVLARVGPDLFDEAIDPVAAQAFLRDPRLHIAVAVDAGVVVGFASGMHYVHPDKPVPQFFVDEVGVAETHRGRGIASAVMGALFEHARELGCAEAWVLTEEENTAAKRLYASVGGMQAPQPPVMFTFRLDG
jgi:aminoglycoside 6'-N-acetyltransferase I